MSNRQEKLAAIIAESQRHYAAYVLLNQALAEHLGMHPTDLQCVALLDGAGGPISTGELARLSGLTPGSASRLVDRLEKAGLVERLADPQDRRKALVALVPAASERIGRAWEEPGTAYGEVLGRYSDAELDVIADYLRRAGAVGMAQAERLRAEA